MSGARLFAVGVAVSVALMLGGCGGGSSGFDSKDPKSVAVKCFESAALGNTEDFMKCFDMSGVTENQKLQAQGKIAAILSQAAESTNAKGGLDSVEAIKETVRGETTIVDIKVTFKDGTEANEQIKVQKAEDGNYYLK